jgi:hypothetical protein
VKQLALDAPSTTRQSLLGMQFRILRAMADGVETHYLVLRFRPVDWTVRSAVTGNPLLHDVLPVWRLGGRLTPSALFLADLDKGRGFFFDHQVGDDAVRSTFWLHPMGFGAVHLALMRHLTRAADPMAGPPARRARHRQGARRRRRFPRGARAATRGHVLLGARAAWSTTTPAPPRPRAAPPSEVHTVGYRMLEAEDTVPVNHGKFLVVTVNGCDRLLIDLQTREGAFIHPAAPVDGFLRHPLQVCVLYLPLLVSLARRGATGALVRFPLRDVVAQRGVLLNDQLERVQSARTVTKRGRPIVLRLRNREVPPGGDPTAGQDVLSVEERNELRMKWPSERAG